MSKYTRIQARVIDQSIQLVNVPRIASGGRDEVRVDFAFCPKWDNLAKTAVFYQDPEWAYKILVVENSAVVPAEALAKDGLFYFGVFGTGADGQVRTTEVVSMMVVKGAVTFQGIQPGEPTPDIYTQLMGAYGELETALAVERARLSELFATRGGGVETFTIEGEYTTGTIKTNGVVAFVSLRMEGDPLPVGAKDSVLLPQHFDPLGEIVETSTPSSPPGGASIIPSRFNDNQGPVLEVTNYFDEEDLTDPIEFEFYYNLAGMSIPELTDLRVGPDGTIYPTAGDAIRAIKQVTVVDFTYDVFAESWNTNITYDDLLGLFRGDKIVVAHLIRGDDECYTMNIDFIPERFRITSPLVWLKWSEGAEIIEIDQPESGGGGSGAVIVPMTWEMGPNRPYLATRTDINEIRDALYDVGLGDVVPVAHIRGENDAYFYGTFELGEDYYMTRTGDLFVVADGRRYKYGHTENGTAIWNPMTEHSYAEQIGDISTALDHIIALQEELIGS